MGDNIQLGPGRLFIKGTDGPELLGNLYTIEPEEEWEMEPWPLENPTIKTLSHAELTLTIKMIRQEIEKLIDALVGFTEAVLDLCPDKRVVHLAKHAKKKRTRKKNIRRAYRIVMKEGPNK